MPVDGSKQPVSSRRRFFVWISISFASLLIGVCIAVFVVRSQLRARKRRLDHVAAQHKIDLRWNESIPWGRPFDRHLESLHDFVGDFFQEIGYLSVGEIDEDLPPDFFEDLSHYNQLHWLEWQTPRHSLELARILSYQRDLVSAVLVMRHLRDRDLQVIPQNVRLETFGIDGLESWDLSGRFLQQFVGQTPNLESLMLRHLKLDNEACAAIGRLTSLEYLDLAGCQLTLDSVKSLTKLSGLKNLDIHGATVDERFGDVLGALTTLTMLEAYGSTVTSESMKQLLNLSRLQYLDISDTSVDDQFASTLEKLTTLVDLRIERTPLTSRGLHGLDRCPGLKRLKTGGKRGDPELLSHLCHCRHLSMVDVAWSGDFSASEMAGFNALPKLSYLYFSEMGDTTTRHLLLCEHVTGLDIHSDRLTIDGVRSLMQMTDLRYLKLAGKVWGPELVDVLYESPTLESVKILDREWEWWEFEDLREKLRSQAQ